MPEDCLLLCLQLDQPALTQQARLQLLSQRRRGDPRKGKADGGQGKGIEHGARTGRTVRAGGW